MPEHTCRVSNNPRYPFHCDCGQRVLRTRNAPLEVEIVEEACRGWVDPDRIIDHAQDRSGKTGPLLRIGVDWLQETLEELADSANYLCWDLEDHFHADDREQLLRAVGLVTDAYESVRRVRENRL